MTLCERVQSNVNWLLLVGSYAGCMNVFLDSAPLAWYMLRAYGATNVALLNGGFPHWKIALNGEKIDSGDAPEQKVDGQFEAILEDSLVRYVFAHRLFRALSHGLKHRCLLRHYKFVSIC